jgi:hypothetical protein
MDRFTLRKAHAQEARSQAKRLKQLSPAAAGRSRNLLPRKKESQAIYLEKKDQTRAQYHLATYCIFISVV